ncbi:unnamed protein product, partial [Amoebophrya sp. A120]
YNSLVPAPGGATAEILHSAAGRGTGSGGATKISSAYNPGNNIAEMKVNPLDDDSDDGFNFLLGPSSRNRRAFDAMNSRNPPGVAGRFVAQQKHSHQVVDTQTQIKDEKDFCFAMQHDFFPTVFQDCEEFYDRPQSPLFPLYKIKTIIDEESKASTSGT